MKKLLIEAGEWYGVAAVIVAYFLVSNGMMSPKDTSYQFLNLSGAIGIIIVSSYQRAYQSVVVNSIWALISLVALIKIVF